MNDGFWLFNYLLAFWKWITQSGLGNIVSILGFLITCYVAWTAHKINKFIFIYRRLPQLIKKLEGHSAILSGLLNNYDQSVIPIQNELSKCSANLKAIKKRVKRQESSSIGTLIKLIANHSSDNTITYDSAREIYRQLLYILEALKNFQVEYFLEK